MATKTHLVGVRVTESQWQELKTRAESKKRKPADLVRVLLENFLEMS